MAKEEKSEDKFLVFKPMTLAEFVSFLEEAKRVNDLIERDKK